MQNIATLKLFRTIFIFGLIALIGQTAEAQFNTPTVNGTIAANEYGQHVNGQNQQTNGGQVWYMTWDDTNLYVGLTGSTTSEGIVIYIDSNPIVPANGGTNANGTLAGFNYDGAVYNPLSMRADFVAYIKDGYNEYRRTNLTGGWTAQTANTLTYASSGGNAREVAIPWNAVTGGAGRPAGFRHLEYAVSGTGFVYGQLPSQNPGGNIGTLAPGAATASNFYAVGSTVNGTTSEPYAQNQTSTTTAASAILSGRVADANGTGIARVAVQIENLPQPRTVYTNSFGFFSFENLPTGATYIVTVNHRRYAFNPNSLAVELNEARSDINFIAGDR